MVSEMQRNGGEILEPRLLRTRVENSIQWHDKCFFVNARHNNRLRVTQIRCLIHMEDSMYHFSRSPLNGPHTTARLRLNNGAGPVTGIINRKPNRRYTIPWIHNRHFVSTVRIRTVCI